MPLGNAMKDFLRASGLGRGMRHGEVFSAWGNALGPRVSAKATPVRFQSGVLTVEVESTALLSELSSFSGEEARSKANELLGEERIRRVVFRTSSK